MDDQPRVLETLIMGDAQSNIVNTSSDSLEREFTKPFFSRIISQSLVAVHTDHLGHCHQGDPYTMPASSKKHFAHRDMSISSKYNDSILDIDPKIQLSHYAQVLNAQGPSTS